MISNDNILLNYKCYACPHEETYPSTSPADPAPICPECFNVMRYVGVKIRIESTATDTTPSWVKPGTWIKITDAIACTLIKRISGIKNHGHTIMYTDGGSCDVNDILTGRVVKANLAPWQADTMLAYLLSKKKFFHDGKWMLGCSLSTNTDGGYTLYLKEQGIQGNLHSIHKKEILDLVETEDHGPCGQQI